MTKKHLLQYTGRARKLRINNLSESNVDKLIRAATRGHLNVEVNQEFREAIEAKSRFIPKIFGDIE